jgi:cytidyltransferase-like protein
MRICLFPGTFDPVTLGHVDIINRALPLFDKIYVGIGINSSKNPMFSPEQRMEWFNEIWMIYQVTDISSFIFIVLKTLTQKKYAL